MNADKQGARFAFITGIPAAGKTTLARKVAGLTGAVHVGLDDLRAGMMDNPELRPWARFYLDQDEAEYWSLMTNRKHWANIVRQSRAFWPVFLARIKEVMKEGKPAIFESVCLMPELVKKDLAIPGICLLAPSFDAVLARINSAPRWGSTKELQELEARAIWEWERPAYEQDANEHGIPVFTDPNQAKDYLSIHVNN